MALYVKAMNSSRPEIIDVLTGLLPLMPGANLSSCRFKGNAATFFIEVNSREAFHELCSIAQGANATVQPVDAIRAVRLGGSELAVPFQLSICASLEALEPELKFGLLQAFGIHLVWRLARLRQIPLETANQLLGQWNGVKLAV